jgi:hypothetical protein
MLFKCQQVVENIRWFYYVRSNNSACVSPDDCGTGIPDLGTATKDLPYLSGDAGYAFWGPDGANVIERDNGPYKISYRIENDDTAGGPNLKNGVKVWVITVSAVPTDVAGTPGAVRYLGIGTNGGGKRVDYVAQFTQ